MRKQLGIEVPRSMGSDDDEITQTQTETITQTRGTEPLEPYQLEKPTAFRLATLMGLGILALVLYKVFYLLRSE